MYTADQKCVVKIYHRIQRKEITKIGVDGYTYTELSNVIEHRMFYKIRLRPTKDREVIYNVVSKKFYIEHLPDANLLYQFWLETTVDDDHYKHGSDSDMVKFEFRDSIGTKWGKKTYKNFVENPMNVHYVHNTLDDVQADFLEIRHKTRAFTITLKPFNARNDNIVDENAEIGSALWNYSAACKPGYALIPNGTHNQCFKPKRVKNRSKCYIRHGLCIACDQTVLERKCFACERGMVLG